MNPGFSVRREEEPERSRKVKQANKGSAEEIHTTTCTATSAPRRPLTCALRWPLWREDEDGFVRGASLIQSHITHLPMQRSYHSGGVRVRGVMGAEARMCDSRRGRKLY